MSDAIDPNISPNGEIKLTPEEVVSGVLAEPMTLDEAMEKHGLRVIGPPVDAGALRLPETILAMVRDEDRQIAVHTHRRDAFIEVGLKMLSIPLGSNIGLDIDSGVVTIQSPAYPAAPTDGQ